MHMQQRQQEVGVAVGNDAQPLELGGGLGLARIDHKHAATALDESCMRSLIRGTVSTLPWDTTGFAPTMTSRSVRIRSGIGSDSGVAVEELAGQQPAIDVL